MSLTGKPALTSSAPIGNDGFWPDLEPGDLLERYRVSATLPDETVRWALTLAAVRVNVALDPAKTVMLAAGHAALDEYTAANSTPMGDSESLLVLYEHAVHARAKSMLVEQFPLAPLDKSADTGSKTSAMDQEQHWLNESAAAISAINTALDPAAPTTSNHNVYVSSL